MARRNNIGEMARKSGFWLQLVFLALVDWGSVMAFRRDGAAWYHYAGIVALNLVLLWAAYLVWRWLRHAKDPGDLAAGGPSHG